MKIFVITCEHMDDPELQIFSGLSEPQLLHYLEPDPGIFIAETPMIICRAIEAGYEPFSMLVEDQMFRKHPKEFLNDCGILCDSIVAEIDIANLSTDCFDIAAAQETKPGQQVLPIYTAPGEILKQITGFPLTRGVLCAMRRKQKWSAEPVLHHAGRVVLLENVMNPTNLGAVFRSAAALGMDAVLMTKGCTDPLYRRAARVSMGAVFQIPWAFVDDGSSGVRLLQSHGFYVAAMTLSSQSIDLNRLQISQNSRMALVLGTEGPGLTEDTIRACNTSVKIPMAHGVDSLNVAAASAVAFWHLCCSLS